MVNKSPDMESLNRDIDSCTFCRSNALFDNGELRHILGAGQENAPSVMFVLMNPTARNPTLSHKYSGERVSYAGVSSLWRILIKVGFLPQSLLSIFKSPAWDDKRSRALVEHLDRASLYLTELVKCPSRQAETPDTQTIQHNLAFMRREIEIVNPRSIIAFGLLPFYSLTRQRIVLGDYHEKLLHGDDSHFHLHERIGDYHHKVYPCYFPTGRGNYLRAFEILKALRSLVIADVTDAKAEVQLTFF